MRPKDAASDAGMLPPDASPDRPVGQIAIALGDVVNVCPSLIVTASPVSARVGGSVALKAWIADPDGVSDAGPGDGAVRLTLLWSAAAGHLSAPSSAETDYACTEPGLQVVTIVVSDGPCTQQESVPLHCLASDAAVEDVPQRDASGGATAMGSGGVEGSGGASGSGGRTGASGGSGASGPTSSGGVTGSGGRASAGGASASATGGSAPSGGRTGSAGASPGSGGAAGTRLPSGAGGGGTGGQSASAGSGGTPSGSGGISATGGTPGQQPSMDEGEACNRCTDDNCNTSTDGCDVGHFQLPSDALLCEALYACLRAQHCTADADGDAYPDKDASLWCWCGLAKDADPTVCFNEPGQAAGPCLAEVEKAAKTSVPSTIRLRFVDPQFPLGRAVNLANCRAGFCGDVCR